MRCECRCISLPAFQKLCQIEVFVYALTQAVSARQQVNEVATLRRFDPGKVIRVVAMDGGQNTAPGPDRIPFSTIFNVELDSTAGFTTMLRNPWCKPGAAKSHSREIQGIQRFRNPFRIDPWCPQKLERSSRPPSFRKIGPFDQACRGVAGNRLKRRQVGRRQHPWQGGFVEPHGSPPAVHGNDNRCRQALGC